MNNKLTWAALTGALGSSFLAFFVTLCCGGPVLLLLALGIGGVWASYFTFFEPYLPYIFALIFCLYGYSFYKLYINPPPCGEGSGCISQKMLFYQRLIFWVILTISIVLLAFPWYAHLLTRFL